MNNKKLINAIGITAIAVAVMGCMMLYQIAIVFASNATSFSQTISDGTKSVDIVDSSGDPVDSPSVTFDAKTFSFEYQTSTGTLGEDEQRIRVYNPTSTATWSIAIAATDGQTALWDDGGGKTYDFNDSNTDGTDDDDDDTKGGRLSIDPTAGTVAGVPDNDTCSPSTGITKGSSSAFQEEVPSVSSITLLSGGAAATTYCRWDFTGIGLSQVIPPSQPSGTYTLSFTITIS